MGAYKLIQEVEQLECFPQLLKAGIIPLNWLDYKVIYEFYLSEIEKGEKSRQAVSNAMEEFKLSERQIYAIVKKMKD